MENVNVIWGRKIQNRKNFTALAMRLIQPSGYNVHILYECCMDVVLSPWKKDKEDNRDKKDKGDKGYNRKTQDKRDKWNIQQKRDKGEKKIFFLNQKNSFTSQKMFHQENLVYKKKVFTKKYVRLN